MDISNHTQNLNNLNGVLIGRFNPPHIGHIELIKDALTKCLRLFIIVGSDAPIRTMRNMFFSHERIEMLKLCFNNVDLNRLSFIPIDDFNNLNAWALSVQEKVKSHLIFDPSQPTILFGFNKDESSKYLDSFPEFEFGVIKNSYFNGISSTQIRRQLCGEVIISRQKRTLEQRLITPILEEPRVDLNVCMINLENSIIDPTFLNKHVAEWISANIGIIALGKIKVNHNRENINILLRSRLSDPNRERFINDYYACCPTRNV